MFGSGNPVVALLSNVSWRTVCLAADSISSTKLLLKNLNYRRIRVDYNGFGSRIY
jgi:hypothetical protein